jgi:hypothetical protein
MCIASMHQMPMILREYTIHHELLIYEIEIHQIIYLHHERLGLKTIATKLPNFKL